MANILVVDDDDIVAEHAAIVLINAGHACGWVSDVKSALDVVKRRSPDLILLDQNMPGENGSAFLRKVRASPTLYDIPIVMLTGVTGIRDEQLAYFNGAQDYIRKPFSEKMLVYRVNQTLAAKRRTDPHGRPHWAPKSDEDGRPTDYARFV